MVENGKMDEMKSPTQTIFIYLHKKFPPQIADNDYFARLLWSLSTRFYCTTFHSDH